MSLTTVNVFLIFVLTVACDKSIVPPDNEQKDPRKYIWTIDTLEYPGEFDTSMRSIWGSSPSDVYVVGYCSDADGQMWHFDGNDWKSFHLQFGVAYTPLTVFGFGKDDVWIGGDIFNAGLDPAFLIHYNGSSWNRITTPSNSLSLESIWGLNSKDIWFGGVNGTLFHWNGSSVIIDSLPILIPKDSNPVYNLLSITGSTSNGNYFLLREPSQRNILFNLSQNNYTILDSNSAFRAKLWIGDNGNLYETGELGFYKWNGNSWFNLLPEMITTYGVVGMSEKSIFVVGTKSNNGLVYHYNGNDFYLFEKLHLPNVSFYDAWTDGKEVFILGTNIFDFNSTLKTIILHGK